MITLVAVLVVATLAVTVGWGLRVINDIEDLENLSARVVGPAAEIGPSWAAAEYTPVSRHVRIHPAAMPRSLLDPETTPAAS